MYPRESALAGPAQPGTPAVAIPCLDDGPLPGVEGRADMAPSFFPIRAITWVGLSPGTGAPSLVALVSSAAIRSMPAQSAPAMARATAITAESVAALPKQTARYRAQIHCAAPRSEVPERMAATASAARPVQQMTRPSCSNAAPSRLACSGPSGAMLPQAGDVTGKRRLTDPGGHRRMVGPGGLPAACRVIAYACQVFREGLGGIRFFHEGVAKQNTAPAQSATSHSKSMWFPFESGVPGC